MYYFVANNDKWELYRDVEGDIRKRFRNLRVQFNGLPTFYAELQTEDLTTLPTKCWYQYLILEGRKPQKKAEPKDLGKLFQGLDLRPPIKQVAKLTNIKLVDLGGEWQATAMFGEQKCTATAMTKREAIEGLKSLI